jgi:hypothetical protein
MLALDAGFGAGLRIESLHTPGTSAQQAQVTGYMTKDLACIATDVEGAWPARTRRYKLPSGKGLKKRQREWLPGR